MDDKDSENDSSIQKYGSDAAKGLGPGRSFGTGGRYDIRTEPGSHSTAMIIDKMSGRLKDGKPVGEAVIRFDRATSKFPHPHINFNPKVSGRPDPHFKVPSGVVEAAPKAGKALKAANKMATPAAITMDAYRLRQAHQADKKAGDKSHSRTKTEAAGVAGSWVGAYGGGHAGAQIGTMVCPGVGTMIGGAAGGLAGSMAGDVAGQWAAERLLHADADVNAQDNECEDS